MFSTMAIPDRDWAANMSSRTNRRIIVVLFCGLRAESLFGVTDEIMEGLKNSRVPCD